MLYKKNIESYYQECIAWIPHSVVADTQKTNLRKIKNQCKTMQNNTKKCRAKRCKTKQCETTQTNVTMHDNTELSHVIRIIKPNQKTRKSVENNATQVK